MRALPLLALLLLASCGESASTWDDKRGRAVGTEQLKQERDREIKDLEWHSIRDPRCDTPARYDAMREGADCS